MGCASGRVRGLTALLAVAALLSPVALAPPASAQEAQPPPCPEPVPLEQLEDGSTAVGYTVSRGTEPEPFDVEILGVLDDGIAPGRDLIVVDTAGAAIDEAGGIWFGMSGSPVYQGDRLVGALGYGFSVGGSSLAGLTPAEDLEALEDPAEAQRTLAGRPALDPALRERAAQRDPQAADPTGRMEPLRVPLAVAGLAPSRTELMQERLDAAGLPFVVTAAGSTAAAQPDPAQPTPAPVAAPGPGENMAAALSLGDVTIAGVGTATTACPGEGIAFGHPFFGAGETRLSALTADALAIVDDRTFGSFKLANLGASYGTVTQDRTAGLLIDTTATPATVPITSDVGADTGARRQGRTDVVDPELVPDLSAFHLLANLDVVGDRIGPGSSTLVSTITGIAGDGTPFAYTRDNVFASPFDIAVDTIQEYLTDAFTITGVDPAATITGVDFAATVSDEVARYLVTEVRVGVDGRRPEVPAGPVVADPGSTLVVEADLDPGDGSGTLTRTLEVVVPMDRAGSGQLIVRGGSGNAFGLSPCFFDPSACAAEADQGLPALLDELSQRARNDELTATLELPVAGGPQPEDPPVEPVVAGEALDRVVAGERFVEIVVEADRRIFDRIAGGDRAGTAAALAQAGFTEAGTVVLARGDTYADALSGAPLAAALDAPLLLTEQSGLSPAAEAELVRLDPETVVVLGGEQAVGPAVTGRIESAGIVVDRIAGGDRFETSRRIAERIGGPVAYLAQGISDDPARGWPDALSVSGLAALQRAPVLLTRTGDLPPDTRAALEGVDRLTVVGGDAAVSAAVETAAREVVANTDRLAGPTRFDTSLAVARRAVEQGAVPGRFLLATGYDFPDALAAGPIAGLDRAQLLLIDGLDPAGAPAQYDYLATVANDYDYVRVVGGPAVVSDEVVGLIGSRINLPPQLDVAPGAPPPFTPPPPPPPPPPGEPPPGEPPPGEPPPGEPPPGEPQPAEPEPAPPPPG